MNTLNDNRVISLLQDDIYQLIEIRQDPYEVGIHATIPVAQASGYNQALDQWEQAILELMK